VVGSSAWEATDGPRSRPQGIPYLGSAISSRGELYFSEPADSLVHIIDPRYSPPAILPPLRSLSPLRDFFVPCTPKCPSLSLRLPHQRGRLVQAFHATCARRRSLADSSDLSVWIASV
jgi:hypothetical protein